MKKPMEESESAHSSRKRAAIYTRVSTDDQGKGYSLTTQKSASQQYLSDRGYQNVGEYADEYTGASLDRPELNNLRKLVEAGGVDVVVVYDIDRLARRSVYQMLIEEEFNRYGVKIEYVNGQYEDSDEGRLQKQIRASIAEYEKAKILERSKRGKRGKAQSGFVMVGCRPPYGYNVKAEPHKAWLEIDEDEAKIVRLVYDLYLRGDGAGMPFSIRAVAKRLCDLQVPTRGDTSKNVRKLQGLGVWCPGMVIHILYNEAYIGRWYYGKTQMVNDGQESIRKPKPKCGLGKQVRAPRKDWIQVDVPPIIKLPDWEAAQLRLKANKRAMNGRPSDHEYLMSRRLRCSRCEYGARGQLVHGKHFYYHCNGKRQLVARCDMPSFRGDWLDASVWNWVKDLMKHPERLREGLRNSQAELDQANRLVRDRLTILDEQIAATQEQLNRLLDLYLSGEFAKGMLAERRARLDQTLADLHTERASMASQLQRTGITEEQIREIEAFCAEVAEGLDLATFEDKRRYLELLHLSGKLAIDEHGQKVVDVICLLGKQRLVQMPTLPSSNIGVIVTTRIVFR